jgi:hypothetical protein
MALLAISRQIALGRTLKKGSERRRNKTTEEETIVTMLIMGLYGKSNELAIKLLYR